SLVQVQVRESLVQALESLVQALESAVQALESALESAVQALESALESAVQALESAVQALESAVQAVQHRQGREHPFSDQLSDHPEAQSQLVEAAAGDPDPLSELAALRNLFL
ncbi:MAG: exonuclease VII small subunit, partial [Verrucomicrobiales bacterium]